MSLSALKPAITQRFFKLNTLYFGNHVFISVSLKKKYFEKYLKVLLFAKKKILRYTPLVNFTGLNNFSLNVLF